MTIEAALSGIIHVRAAVCASPPEAPSAHTGSSPRSAPEAWARCIAPSTYGSDARSPSRCCTSSRPTIPSTRAGSSAKRACSRRSTIPNIATLHGLEEVGDSTLLEMELVPGETLAERIGRGPMPPPDTLPIFKQIAQALEAAHERGIIHRDLKPSNVKVTPEGRVKVLDFGLAKAFESERPESSSNAALFTTTTQRGLILGTAAYMSPEHVRGKTLDRRTDIWAFGCMFYEAITGKPPFASETVSDTLAAVLREEPDWRQLVAGAGRGAAADPALPEERSADAAARHRRRQPRDRRRGRREHAAASCRCPATIRVRFSRRRAVFTAAAALALLAAVTAIVLWAGGRARPASDGAIARARRADSRVHSRSSAAVSRRSRSAPDGTLHRLRGDRERAAARSCTCVRSTSSSSTPIAGHRGRQRAVPLARWPLDRLLRERHAAARVDRRRRDDQDRETPAVWSAAWGADDTIVFAGVGGAGRPVARRGRRAATPERLTTVDTANGEIQHGYPRRLPERRRALQRDHRSRLALRGADAGDQAGARARAAGQRRRRRAVRRRAAICSMRAAAASSRCRSIRPSGVTGSPIPLLERPEVDPSGGAAFAVSANGTLAYLPRRDDAAAAIAGARSIAPAGRRSCPRRAAPSAIRASRATAGGSPSPSNRTTDPTSGSTISSAAAGRRLTSGGVNSYPIWSHDGLRVTFQSARSGGVALYSRNADGSGDAGAAHPLG